MCITVCNIFSASADTETRLLLTNWWLGDNGGKPMEELELEHSEDDPSNVLSSVMLN
jgi:hypothetical protein